MNNDSHNCDLFLLSSHHPYHADNILTHFASRGTRNIHGWGIGSYTSEKAVVIKSEDNVFNTGNRSINGEYIATINATSSPIILGHLRLSSAGDTMEENNHPFRLGFLDYEWLFMHNGTSNKYQKLVPYNERLLLDSNSDSPRIFEFMRREIIKYYLSKPQRSLIMACRTAYETLLEKDPGGTFNIILSNGHISFVFIHFRPFYILNREKYSGDVALMSTIRLTDDEEWITVNKLRDKKAKMLVYNGQTLIFNGDIPA